jgi:hypothetical protein
LEISRKEEEIRRKEEVQQREAVRQNAVRLSRKEDVQLAVLAVQPSWEAGFQSS